MDAVQIPYNVLNRAVEDELLPLAEELGTGILVMEPLQKGRYVLELKQQPDLTPLRDYGISTWAQALLAWVISDLRVSSAIPTTSPPRAHPGKRPGSRSRRAAPAVPGLHPFRGGAVVCRGQSADCDLEVKWPIAECPSAGRVSERTGMCAPQRPPPTGCRTMLAQARGLQDRPSMLGAAAPDSQHCRRPVGSLAHTPHSSHRADSPAPRPGCTSPPWCCCTIGPAA